MSSHTAAEEVVDQAIERALDWLGKTQEAKGQWDGKASSETIFTAWLAYALWTYGNRAATPALDWLVANQNTDGGWGGALGQPSYLDATTIALAVLRECGHLPATSDVLRRGDDYLVRNPGRLGGILGTALEACMSGDFSRLPPPRPGMPLKRATYLATLLPGLVQRSRAVPRFIREPVYSTALGFASHRDGRLDRMVRRRATRTLESLWDQQGRWIMPGIGLVALRKFGHEPDERVAARALEWASDTQNDDGGWGWSPGGQFLDTALPVLAALEAGVQADSPMIRSAVDWIRSQRALEGGWGGHIAAPPDGDDTAAGIWALCAVGENPADGQLAESVRLLKKLQTPDGSWGHPEWVGAGRAEETAIALRALLAAGEPRDSNAVRQACRWLICQQAPIGTWPTRWYVQDLNSCFRVLTALRAAGYAPSNGVLRMAATHLHARWRPDGPDAQQDDAVDNAAYWVLALMEVEGPDHPSVLRTVGWLAERQDSAGTWAVGYNGYAGDPDGAWLSYYRDRMWTHAHALWALARFRRLRGERTEG